MVASGNEVGKISIRVVPNLDEFHDDLKRQLAEEEKKRHTIKIGVDVDTSSIPREIKAAERSVDDIEVGVDTDTSSISSDIQSAASDVDATVKVDAEFDRQQLLAETRRLTQSLKTDVELTPDGKKFKKDIEDMISALKRQIRNLPIGIELDQTRAAAFAAEVEAVKLLIDQNDVVLGIRAEVDTASVESGLARLRAQIAGFTRGLRGKAGIRVPVDVDVDVDKNRISRSLSAITSGISSGLKGLGKAVDAAGNGLQALSTGATSAVKAVARLPEWLLLTAAVSAILAPALALVAGSLVALPGLLTAFAVPIGAVALGVDGIKKAAEAAKPAFEKLKQTMSDTFQQNMTPAFQNLADKLFPRLQAAMPKVAESLSNLFETFSNTITNEGNLNKIEGTIRGIAAALNQAKPGVESFTNAFTSLINSTAGPLMSSLSNTVNQLGAEFEAWVGKVTANGQLQQAMETLKGTLGEIGGIFKDIASFSFDALSDPQFGASMKGFVQDARELTNMILPLLKSGFEDVASAVSGIVDAFEQIRGAAGWITDLIGKFDQLTGVKEDAGAKEYGGFMGLGGKDGVFGDKAPFRQWFSDAPEAAAEAGSEAGQKFQESLASAATSAGDGGAGLTAAINKQLVSAVDVSKDLQAEALRSAFTGSGVTDAVGNQIATQMGAVIAKAQESVRNLGPTLQADIDAALMPLNQIPQKLMSSFTQLGAAVGGAWSAIKNIVTENANGIGDAVALSFQTIPAKLTTAFAGLGAAVAGAMIALKGVVASNAAGIADAFGQAFAGAAGRVSAALSGVPGAVASALSPALGVVATVAAGMVQTMAAGLAGMVPVVEASFSAIPAVVAAKMAEANAAVAAGGQQMVSTALAFAGAMESAGRSIGASFAAGIASSASLVSAAAESLVAAARVFFPNSPAEEGPFSGSGWVDKSGEAVGEGFAKGMSNSQQEVVATARELMQAVKDIFGTAEGLTLNFNMGPITQTAQQATSAVKTFGDTLTAIPTKQLDALTPVTVTQSGGRDALSQQLDSLEIERKSLELQKSQAGANQAAIKARLEEIKQQKLQLGLQRDQLDYANKYGDQVDASGSKMDEAYKDLTKKALNMPVDFGRTVASQFGQDLGVSGGGLLGAITDYGLQFGSQFVFNVSNIDEAMAVQQNQVNKKGMGVVGR